MTTPSNSINIKISDDEQKGRYSNLLRIAHTPAKSSSSTSSTWYQPAGIVSARIVTSPGHLKRIIGALQSNLERYEKSHGPVEEAPDPAAPIN